MEHKHAVGDGGGVVTVGYHDAQQIYSNRRKNEGRGEIETNKGMELTLVA